MGGSCAPASSPVRSSCTPRTAACSPSLASRQHVRDILPVIERSMAEADANWDDLAAVAVTYGPGLSGALMVGVNVAKGLAMARDLPLVGVSHLEGHIYSNWLHTSGRVRTPQNSDGLAVAKAEDPPFPNLALIVSGGHTELVLVRDHGDYEVLGATLDDAAGEAFDKAARMLGLGYPGGPEVQRAAEVGHPTAYEFPVADTASALDFSFSGLKTAVLRAVESAERSGGGLPVADLAASFQAAVVRALVGRVRLALVAQPVPELHVAGGVSANTALRSALRKEIGVPVRYPPLELCTDNAAMVAAAGYWAFRAGRVSGLDLDVAPGLRLGD